MAIYRTAEIVTDRTNNNMDLVLINPGGRGGIYQSLGNELTAIEPPLWCRIIAGYVRDQGYSVTIIDSEADNLAPPAVAQKVHDLAPHLICVVVFGHQPSASTQQMVPAGETCRALKDIAPSIPLLIVGGHVSALPERTLQEEAVDFACKGEGPATDVQLLKALLTPPLQLAGVEGLVWKKDGEEIIVNPSAPLTVDLDKEFHGSAWDLLPMDKYRAHNWQCFGDLNARMPYASIYTSLGCPYKCNFCCINAPFDSNRYRMRDPKKVVEEIDLLYNVYGVKTFKIIDEMFVLNERHVTSICDLLIERDLDLNIWAYARIDTIKPHFLKKLRKAGFRWLALGIESGSEHVRNGAAKTLRSEDIVNIVRQIQMADINVIGNYIFGLPGDDLETMQQTLDLAIDLNCEFGNFYSAMAYPGSPLYLSAIEDGLDLPLKWSGYSQHSYDCKPLSTDNLTAAEILEFRDTAFHHYFEGERYLTMATQKFGWETRKHIEEMSKHRLSREIVEVAKS